MNMPLSIMILMIALTLGYPFSKAMAQDSMPLVSYVQDLNKAKDILKPERKSLLITHDPFNPIIVIPPPGAYGMNNHAVAASPDDQLDDVQVIGIVRLDQEYSAYVTIGAKSRVVSMGDKIRKYTITNIDMDQIVLKSENKKITKKRGKS